MARSLISARSFWYTFSGWWLIWAALHGWLISSYGFNLKIAVTDSILSNLCLATGSMLVFNLLKYYLPRRERYWYILVFSICLSFVILFLLKYLLPLPFPDDAGYLIFLNHTWTVRFGITFLLIGCANLLSLLWYTAEDEKENQARQSEAENLAREAELFKLRQQLQPHFLFNSLNSISALAGNQPEQARKMIQQLSDFLRGTLKKDELQWIKLSEELQYLSLYLDIEKVRFGHRLITGIEAPAEVMDMKLPPMLLQPIVENAIKFGLYDTTGEVTITLSAKKENQLLLIEVTNPFDPDTASPQLGTGFGLKSVQRRLFLLFARNDLLKTDSVNGIFLTQVRIPQLITEIKKENE